MEIDLSSLHSGVVDKVSITGNYKLDKDYYQNTDIISLGDISVVGDVFLKEDEDGLKDYVKCQIKGVMIIPDVISLEEVEYPFTIDYDDFILENDIKSENLLDILGFLWENIVLEVPLHFTKVRDLSKFHGDGWSLISEDELINHDNPFSDLLKDFEKE